MKYALLLLSATSIAMIPDNTDIQSQPNQEIQIPQDNTNVWNIIDPNDKPYQGDNAPSWAWVLTDWGD